jgi:DNA-binding MarR family transcriptional regulator
MKSYLSYSLALTHRKVNTSLTIRLKALGVQVEVWRVMELLSTQNDLTMGKLAKLALMNPPTLSKLVDRMVGDGIVHRLVGNNDQRQVNLVLTDLGHKRIYQMQEQAKIEDDDIHQRIGNEKATMLNSILAEIAASYD